MRDSRGPLGTPVSPQQRRQRILAIGNESIQQVDIGEDDDDAHETSPLIGDHRLANSYGSLPPEGSNRTRRPLAPLSRYTTNTTENNLSSSHVTLKRTLSQHSSFFNSLRHRPISAYDEALTFQSGDHAEVQATADAARINGVRVWYSSFTSIDWLHDAVRAQCSSERFPC